MANKVKYGLKNCYYAPITVSTTGTESFGAPVALPGAVSISMEPQGDLTKFYADNTVYWQNRANQGYEGELELAVIPEGFKLACLAQRKDSAGLLVESAGDKAKRFALLFEFDGDEAAVKHVLYDCIASRPAVASNTNNETIEPITESLTITAVPYGADGYVKASADKNATNYESFYTTVQEPGTFAQS